MRKIATPVLAALLIVTITSFADAAALFWSKVITTQKTHAGCMRSAQSNGLINVRVLPDEVSGTSLDQKIYVAITCVERPGLRAVAFIAGAGEDLAAVRTQVQSTAEQVRTAGVPDFD